MCEGVWGCVRMCEGVWGCVRVCEAARAAACIPQQHLVEKI